MLLIAVAWGAVGIIRVVWVARSGRLIVTPIVVAVRVTTRVTTIRIATIIVTIRVATIVVAVGCIAVVPVVTCGVRRIR